MKYIIAAVVVTYAAGTVYTASKVYDSGTGFSGRLGTILLWPAALFYSK